MPDALKEKSGDKIRWGYVIAFILLLLSYILTFSITQQVLNQQKRVSHTNEIINTLDDLISQVKSAESGVRGYLIIKNNIFLNDYHSAPHLVDSTFSHLRLLTRENILQQKKMDTLQLLIKNKFDILSTGLILFKTNNSSISDSMTKLAYRGKQMMENIKLLVAKLQNEESNNIANRSNRATNLSNFIKVINVASLVIAIVLAFYSIRSFNRENRARQYADKEAAKFRNQLQLRVDELDKLNKELIELRSIEKFAATGRISRTIAHEVRNPLTNINLATEHLRSEMPAGAETEMLLEMITRNSNRINELISDLLNSTKATQLNFKKVEINEMLNLSLGFAEDRIKLKEIKVIKTYTAELCPILADIEKITIAFLNIIVNAVEAMEAKTGILTLKTENLNNRCVATISDNGKGIDKESLSKLFEPYFTTKEKGNGLGLTNTQNIILSHHANIYVESVEGQGTSFILSFNYA